MSAPPPSPFLLAGPTASGKSRVAVALARRWGGEIVNGDPFQAWRGMEILTAQPPMAERGGVPHHGYGCLDPAEDRDAAGFAVRVAETCGRIAAAGRLPIVVSGSGLYLRAMMGGLDPGLPAPDPELRRGLESRPLPDLLAELDRLDPVEGARIDRRNPRRVVRALEICLLSGKPASVLRQSRLAAGPAPIAGVCLDWPPETLRERIRARTEALFGAPLAAEVRALATRPLCPTAAQTLGLREATAWAHGSLGRDEAVAAVAQATARYGRRQRTWFRQEPRLAHFHADDVETEEALAGRVAAGWEVGNVE